MCTRDVSLARALHVASCRFTIDVAATPLSIVHYTVDLDNASCGLTFSAERVVYAGNLLLNHPTPGQIKPGMSAITRKRYTRFCAHHLTSSKCPGDQPPADVC